VGSDFTESSDLVFSLTRLYLDLDLTMLLSFGCICMSGIVWVGLRSWSQKACHPIYRLEKRWTWEVL